MKKQKSDFILDSDYCLTSDYQSTTNHTHATERHIKNIVVAQHIVLLKQLNLWKNA